MPRLTFSDQCFLWDFAQKTRFQYFKFPPTSSQLLQLWIFIFFYFFSKPRKKETYYISFRVFFLLSSSTGKKHWNLLHKQTPMLLLLSKIYSCQCSTSSFLDVMSFTFCFYHVDFPALIFYVCYLSTYLRMRVASGGERETLSLF